MIYFGSIPPTEWQIPWNSVIAGVKLDLAAATEFIFQRRRFLGVRHAFLPHHLRTMGREADVSGQESVTNP